MGKAIANTRRCVVFNSVDSFRPVAAPRKVKLTGFQYLSSIPAFVKALRTGQQRGSFRICYTPLETDDVEDFGHVSRLVWFAQNCVFAIDEVWLYQKPAWSPFYLRKMTLTGRHPGITLLWTAQRPQLTDACLRNSTDQYYVGGFDGKLEIDALQGKLKDEALAKLPTLQARTFIYRDEMKNWRLYKSR